MKRAAAKLADRPLCFCAGSLVRNGDDRIVQAWHSASIDEKIPGLLRQCAPSDDQECVGLLISKRSIQGSIR